MTDKNKEENLNFEDGLAQLEKMSKELDSDDLSLAKASNLYKEAKELASKLQNILDEASLSVKDTEGKDIDIILD